jgi:hypothetical protein
LTAERIFQVQDIPAGNVTKSPSTLNQELILAETMTPIFSCILTPSQDDNLLRIGQLGLFYFGSKEDFQN